MNLGRRLFLKLLLGLSGITALAPFVPYANYFSFNPAANAGRKKVAKSSEILRNSALYFQWPTEAPRDVNILIRDDSMNLCAFNAKCTHMGCQVSYNPAMHLIMCPCHGSIFNPQTGKVMQGPATSPLTAIKLEVDGDGIYAVQREGEN